MYTKVASTHQQLIGPSVHKKEQNTKLLSHFIYIILRNSGARVHVVILPLFISPLKRVPFHLLLVTVDLYYIDEAFY